MSFPKDATGPSSYDFHPAERKCALFGTLGQSMRVRMRVASSRKPVTLAPALEAEGLSSAATAPRRRDRLPADRKGRRRPVLPAIANIYNVGTTTCEVEDPPAACDYGLLNNGML